MLKKGLILLTIPLWLTGCVQKEQSAPNNTHTQIKTQVSVSQTTATSTKTSYSTDSNKVEVVQNPESLSVLINKQNRLPEGYVPSDLVTPNIPYLDSQKEKRKMKKEAAAAIERLFAGAKEQGIILIGVSAFRSYQSQETLFNYYENQDGYQNAVTYSALPGTSEHETGLAIDVTGGNGKCAAEDCFAGTKEAKWLQDHVADYGFIIRYPDNKTSITGYEYEPWHIRYVGTALAKTIMSKGITLEEYYNAVPIIN
ncbi:M15 family metallopeptidase [Neobacillus cucumis]|uniref:M15 family metallopeptidase n=1 Tax=Neobacillus cucumis TaxID=1740721 RepID=UPI001965ABD8|nr:M15 family metallopeptidase [Neobacillus cucumis]MBM7652269.1 D-alanyl-D-alanine carboxypeptidase [Neobacillus cucumis]